MITKLKNIYHLFLAWLGAVIYRNPSRELIVIGITGTKGKTTSVELLRAVLQASGRKTAMLSSANIAFDNESQSRTGNTMPGRFFIQKFMRQAVSKGCEYAVFEVTSQGVVQHRHRFIDFNVAAVTCLHPEHIESHGGYEQYREAKATFFRDTARLSRKQDKKFFINSEMTGGGDAQFFEDAVRHPTHLRQGFGGQAGKGHFGTVTYYNKADFVRNELQGDTSRPHTRLASAPRQQPDLSNTRSDGETAARLRLDGSDKVVGKSGAVPSGSDSSAQLRRYASEPMTSHMVSSASLASGADESRTRGGGEAGVGSVSSWLQSDFNLENAAMVFAIARALGLTKESILATFKEFAGVAGRLEFIRGAGRTAVIDYALTPGSLKVLYAYLKTLVQPGGKLIAVFGSAGGGRDTWKRPELGKLADEFCDKIYLTTDDSYDENTEHIINDIKKGISSAEKCEVIINRAEAISEALRGAGEKDIVAITGMGSQSYTYGPGGKKLPWSDKAAVEKTLRTLQ